MQTGLDGVVVGLAHLVEDVPDLVRPATLHGQAGIDDGQGGQEAGGAIDADHLEAPALKPPAEKIGQKLLPLGGAFGEGQAKVDDLLLAVRPDPQGHQHRALERPGPGLAREHHAVEHEYRILVLQRPAMEGGDRPVQGLGHLAHRAGADPSAEHRGERRRNLAGRQPEHEAGQDHAVDVAGSTGVGAHDSQGAETPCARYRKFDVAKLGHEMTAVRAVAPVALVQRCHLGKMAIDPGRHAFLKNVLERRARRASVILAPFDPFGLHDLHHPKRTW